MLLYRLTICLWILFLFDPARLIAYYAPALSPLIWIRELLLYGTLVLWILSPVPRRNMKCFMAFLGLTIFGTFIAFILGNWGLARAIVRQIFQYYALGIISFSVLTRTERASTLIRIYLFSFFFYGLWGLSSLVTTPLTGDIDPATRKLVYWHIHFDNRDGFGPLMVMGFALAFYLYRAMQSRRSKLLAGATAILGIVGIITSFGRGVFVSFIVVIGHIWLTTRRRILTTAALVVAVVIFSLAAPDIAQRYWDTMKTISSEGISSGTGLDRKILWGWAWREFLSSPVYGVGTGNFSIALLEIVGYDEIIAAGYTPGGLWRRALHCAPMTVLCEYGLIGAVVMVCLVVDVFRSNRRIRKHVKRRAGPGGEYDPEGNFLARPSALRAVADGLNAVLIATVVSAFFYELLYTPIFWHLIVVNRLVYLVSREYGGTREYEIERS